MVRCRAQEFIFIGFIGTMMAQNFDDAAK